MVVLGVLGLIVGFCVKYKMPGSEASGFFFGFGATLLVVGLLFGWRQI